jgi:hypothetical protein
VYDDVRTRVSEIVPSDRRNEFLVVYRYALGAPQPPAQPPPAAGAAAAAPGSATGPSAACAAGGAGGMDAGGGMAARASDTGAAPDQQREGGGSGGGSGAGPAPAITLYGPAPGREQVGGPSVPGGIRVQTSTVVGGLGLS